jgi:hypothetical protein
MSLDTVVLNMERFEELRRRDKMIDAIYKTGTIVALGTTFYMGCFLYRFFTDVQVNMKNQLASVVAQDWPQVDPNLRMVQASAAYAAILKIDPKSTDASIAGYINSLLQNSGIIGIIAGAVYQPGSPEYKEWSSFEAARAKIDADGNFNGLSAEHDAVIKAWRALYKSGFSSIDPNRAGAVHPVDSFTSFVVSDKWYWGGVLGLSALPIIGITLEELKRVEHEVTAGR